MLSHCTYIWMFQLFSFGYYVLIKLIFKMLFKWFHFGINHFMHIYGVSCKGLHSPFAVCISKSYKLILNGFYPIFIHEKFMINFGIYVKTASRVETFRLIALISTMSNRKLLLYRKKCIHFKVLGRCFWKSLSYDYDCLQLKRNDIERKRKKKIIISYTVGKSLSKKKKTDDPDQMILTILIMKWTHQ